MSMSLMWGLKAPRPSSAVNKLSQTYADCEDRTSTDIIAVVVESLVGTRVVTAGIAVLVWWFRYHFCNGNTLMRRIHHLDRPQDVQTRKMRIIPESADRTLGGQSVSKYCIPRVNAYQYQRH